MQDIEKIQQTLSILNDWEDRYRYIMELGQELAPYPPNKRNNTYKVNGCISQVWLYAQTIETQDHKVHLNFLVDSDSHMVRGLLAIVLAVYNNKTSKEILSPLCDEQITQLNLQNNITPQRSNGIYSVIKKIKEFAQNNHTSLR